MGYLFFSALIFLFCLILFDHLLTCSVLQMENSCVLVYPVFASKVDNFEVKIEFRGSAFTAEGRIW